MIHELIYRGGIPSEDKHTVIYYRKDIADNQRQAARVIAVSVLLRESIYAAVASFLEANLPNVLLYKNRPSELVVNASALDSLPRGQKASFLPPRYFPIPALERYSNIIILPQGAGDLVGATQGNLGIAARYVTGMMNSGLAPFINELLPLVDFQKKARQLRYVPEAALSSGLWAALIKLLSGLPKPLIITAPPPTVKNNAIRKWIENARTPGTMKELNCETMAPDILVEVPEAEGELSVSEPSVLWRYSTLAPLRGGGRPPGETATSKDWFCDTYAQKYFELFDLSGDLPTKAELGVEYGISERTVSNYLKT